ncbi:helix-turn-helix transcriptional regulator [Microbacterium oxydans]|uniref:helix-turn-helix domain-containing protein n=1 Tax=Microbacterium sp. B19(2022) TaxID=2914045 RepID=UPI00142FA9E8|nr:helix-turn-helix transcriptional regulator [Microbacterium sp. B19(2022)]
MPTGTQPLPSPLSQHVGLLLSEAISDRGLAQARVADEAGISPSQLSRALTGKKVFTLDQLDAVCDVIGVDLIEVIAAADAATKARPRRKSGELIHGQFGVSGSPEDMRAVAKKKSRDPGGDEGEF